MAHKPDHHVSTAEVADVIAAVGAKMREIEGKLSALQAAKALRTNAGILQPIGQAEKDATFALNQSSVRNGSQETAKLLADFARQNDQENDKGLDQGL